MADVIGNSEWASRHYLEQLQANLKRDGDDRLTRALADYDVSKFALSWITSVATVILITIFMRSTYLGNGLDCILIMLIGVVLGWVAQAACVAQQPGETQSQKDAYAQLSHEEEAELGPSTRHLMALKIRVGAIQDDIDTQTK